MELSIDMLDVGNADAIVLWVKDGQADSIIFLDGGKRGDGEKVVKHYEEYIKPHVKNPKIYIINSHPHRDHIGGLFEIVEYFKYSITRVYFNNPLLHIQDNQRALINEHYSKNKSNNQITGLFESLNDVDNFKQLLENYKLEPCPIFSDTTLDHNLFKVLGPSKAFYMEKVQLFTDTASFNNMVLLNESKVDVNEAEEGNKPCEVVDEKNDTSEENLTSTIIQLTDSKNRKYLFTADSGVASFESAENNKVEMTNFYIVQLPHHGSRRNVNTKWICKFNPAQYWVSAIGDKTHPRRAVLECIKKNLPDCKVYGTHKGGTKHFKTNSNCFPNRNWNSAIPL